MINVSQVRAHITATEGDVMAVPKHQLIEMLAELEVGQHARRLITNLRSQLNISAAIVGTGA